MHQELLANILFQTKISRSKVLINKEETISLKETTRKFSKIRPQKKFETDSAKDFLVCVQMRCRSVFVHQLTILNVFARNLHVSNVLKATYSHNCKKKDFFIYRYRPV